MRKMRFCVIIFILLVVVPVSLADDFRWIRKADIPTPRWGMATSLVNGRIYAIGGSPDNQNALSTVEEYDPEIDTWTKKADMPTPRWYFTASVVNDKIYAIGGQKTGWPGTYWEVVEEYDPATDTWTKKANMPYGRQGFTTSVVNEKIYLFGGTHGNDSFEYDPATDIWTWKTAFPQPLRYWGVSSAVVDGKIYVIGGYTNGLLAATVDEYDPVTDSWEQKADMPTARSALATSTVNGKIYAIGGDDYLSRIIAAVEVYDPATDKWEKKNDMPNPRTWLPGVVIDGKIYIVGGGASVTSNPLPIVEAYDTYLGMEITDISPQEGPVAGGGAIAILGSDFITGAKVTIGGKPLTQLNVTNSLITGVMPPGAEGEQYIEISVPDFNYSGIIGRFFYQQSSQVAVTGIRPINGRQVGGEPGSISGSGFLPGATVTIGENQATEVGVTLTLITLTIPPGIEGVRDVVVTNPDGQKGILRDAYTYNPLPVIGNIRPGHGGPLAGGTEITITGEHFMDGVVVSIGEKRVQKLDFFSLTELRLKTPPGEAGPKTVTVINPDEQEAVKKAGFTYNPAPTITSIKPDAGPMEGGTVITITGTGFLGMADVLIGGAEAFSRQRTPTEIIANTPPSGAGVKDVVVINRDGQEATLKDAFTYNPAPVITKVIPDNGRLAGGTSITIQGSGFLPGAKVFFSTGTGTLMTAQSVQAMSGNIITAGGTKIIIEGTGFLQGVRVAVGGNAGTAQLQDENTIQVVTPSNPPGAWDVRVLNPDTQEVTAKRAFITVGEIVYNFPNPFRASRGTTFRYMTRHQVQYMTIKIFNLSGSPVDVVETTGSNEVKWLNSKVRIGLYVYLVEAELENGERRQFRSMLEVQK